MLRRGRTSGTPGGTPSNTPVTPSGFAGGHVQVRIDLPRYRELKAWFEEHATRRSVAALAAAFYDLPFEPYALVRRQQFHILRAVNRRRKAAGMPPVPNECIWLKRRPVKPFGEGLKERQPDSDIGKNSPADPERPGQGAELPVSKTDRRHRQADQPAQLGQNRPS